MSGPALIGTTGGSQWSGGAVTERAHCVLAPNPGPMTLDGTNTWVVSVPGEGSVVVDPGPDDARHLRAVLEVAEAAEAPVREVLLTHGHLDHSEGAAAFADLAGGVPVRALDPGYRFGGEGLGDGDVVAVGDTELRVVGTPGHTADSLTFLLVGPGGTGLLTGDTVLGRGTTVVAHPDGRLGPYLDSLRRLRDLAERVGGARVLPGHGPVLEDAHAAVLAYLSHREVRLEQVRAALAAGDATPEEVVRRVYADVDRVLWPAAELSVRAQLEYLAAV